jgi:hypothetical protein
VFLFSYTRRRANNILYVCRNLSTIAHAKAGVGTTTDPNPASSHFRTRKKADYSSDSYTDEELPWIRESQSYNRMLRSPIPQPAQISAGATDRSDLVSQSPPTSAQQISNSTPSAYERLHNIDTTSPGSNTSRTLMPSFHFASQSHSDLVNELKSKSQELERMKSLVTSMELDRHNVIQAYLSEVRCYVIISYFI